MCTVVFAFRRVPGFPMVLGANRDEVYARPTAGPRVLIDHPRAVGGIDLQAGGTWMAVSRAGYCAGLTNFHGADAPEGARSRGQLVLDLARAGSAEAAARALETIDPSRYPGFNAFVASPQALITAYSRPDATSIAIEALDPGIHVLPNLRANARVFKVDRARALLGELRGSWTDTVEALTLALSDHEMPERVPPHPVLEPALARAIQALCVHSPFYGTRSSAIVGFTESGGVRYLHAEGPPCDSGFVDHSALLR